MLDPQEGKNVPRPQMHLGFVQPQLARTKGYFVPDRSIEELRVGILKDESNSLAERSLEAGLLQSFFRQTFAPEP